MSRNRSMRGVRGGAPAAAPDRSVDTLAAMGMRVTTVMIDDLDGAELAEHEARTVVFSL